MGDTDEYEKVLQEAINKLSRKFFIWLVAGGVAVGGFSSTGIVRTGKFTTDDGDALEARIDALERYDKEEQQDCQAYRNKVDLKFEELEWHLRRDMPPAATKARIRATERWIEKSDMTWQPPILEWQ